jgi:hypothetical protein
MRYAGGTSDNRQSYRKVATQSPDAKALTRATRVELPKRRLNAIPFGAT